MSNDDLDNKPGANPPGDDKPEPAKPPVKADAATSSKQEANQDSKREQTAREKKSSGVGKALLRLFVLLIVVGALIVAGWYGWQWLEAESSEYQAAIATQSRELERLQAQLERLEETRAADEELEALRESLSAEQSELRNHVQQLVAEMEGLQDAAQGGRRDLLLSEIEYLLRIAPDELYLTQDVDTAIYALQTADERLRQFGQPRLMPVRQLIAEHLQALRAVNLPDVSGMALKLGSLMREVSHLPLRQAQHARAIEDDAVAAGDGGNWWERFQAGVARLFDELVVVQRAEPPAPLLRPEEHFFLYRNVELQLAAARAALLAGVAAAYRQSLELAREWLTRYFDQNDAEVQSAIADITGLLSVPLQPDLPDITTALERFRALTRNGARGE